MWISTLGFLGCLVGIVVCLLVAHHDGVMVGEERAYSKLQRAREAERRVSEGRNRIGSRRYEFYNYEMEGSDSDATRIS